MRKVLFLTLLLLVLLSSRRSGQILQDETSVIGCAPVPGIRGIQADASGRYAPVFPGWGHYSRKVATSNDSAQFFFDQGLNMYYSYHLIEALASFKEAARHDPACVMAWWGQALALGPYYNSYTYKMPVTVLPVLVQMDRLAAGVSGKEKELADVMGSRYSTDTTDSRRKELNRTYAEGLARLIRKYPSDVDIKALYIDAVMLEHTWDFWNNDGTPKPWTGEVVTYCDEILGAYPSHPAALHYQIHLTEASRHPEKALHSADVLQASMPGVAHMVHMSSHMYQRNGLYAKGVDINEKATGLAVAYDSMASNLKLGLFGLTHYDGVGAFCAMNANMFGKAIGSSQHCRNILGSQYRGRLSSPFFQYLYMMPTLAYIRSGKWKEVMEEAAPDSSLHYASLLYEFGKGLACIRMHDIAGAHRHLDQLRVLSKDGSLAVRIMPFNAPGEGARIAEGILAGELLFEEKNYDKAIHAFEEAVSVEDKMIYREPRDWPIPARHFLGAALLKLNRVAEAEKVYGEDLVFNPGNGWAQLGLYQCFVLQHETKMSERYKTLYTKAFSDAEEVPTASVY